MHSSCASTALLALAACAAPTAPTFNASITAVPLIGPAPDPSITRSGSSVRISWWIGTNEPCYEFAATAAASRDTLVVTVAATRREGMCLQVLAAFSYTVTVSGVTPATRALRLVYDRRGPPTYVETALEQSLGGA